MTQIDREFESAFYYSPIGFAIVSTDGLFMRVNKFLINMFGYSEKEFLSMTFYDITHPDDLQLGKDCVDDLVSGAKKYCQFEKRYIHKNGETIWCLLNTSIIRNKKGDPIHLVSQILDIHKTKNLEKELKRSNQELERFAYAASHDLREPLRTINGFAELLNKKYGKDFDETAVRYVDFIKKGCCKMDSLISILLTYSKVERDMEESFTEVRMSEVVKMVCESLIIKISETNSDIEWDRDMPCLYTNQNIVFQLFLNLIVNSIKFKKKDERCKIEISCKKDNHNLIFSIKDNGIGIEKKYQKNIFEIFNRLHDRSMEGSGVGLAICKKIVANLGGEIWVESIYKKGSTFHFTIPNRHIIDE